MAARYRPSAVALVVILMHVWVVIALLQQRLVMVRTPAPLVVSLIEGPKRDVPVRTPTPELTAPVRAHLIFEAPPLVVIPEITDPAAPVASAAPAAAPVEPTTATAAVATVPVPLADELAVFCPTRTPPAYPPQSKHLREQGEVTLQVELDEHGGIAHVAIVKGSGFARLDEAARVAVQSWHCNAATLHGRPTRAVATQSLEFVLQRR